MIGSEIFWDGLVRGICLSGELVIFERVDEEVVQKVVGVVFLLKFLQVEVAALLILLHHHERVRFHDRAVDVRRAGHVGACLKLGACVGSQVGWSTAAARRC